MKSKKRENKSQKKKGGSISDFFMNLIWIILVIGIISSGIWLYMSSQSTVSALTTKTSGNKSYSELLDLGIIPHSNLGQCWEKQLKHYDIDMKLQENNYTIKMKDYIIKKLEDTLQNLGLYMGNKSNNPGFNYVYGQPQYQTYPNPNKII